VLSLRSEVVVTIAVAVGLGVILDYFDSLGSWAEPRAADWYTLWVVFGALWVAAIVSVVVDVRRHRTWS